MPDIQVTFDELIRDGALEIGDGYRAKNSELNGHGLPFMRAGNLTNSGWNWDGLERFESDLTSSLASKVSRPGDTVITTKGNSVGRSGYVDSDAPQFVYSPHLSFWRAKKPEKVAPRFLRYWAMSPEFLNQLRALGHGTDMAPYLSLSDQRRLRVSLPETGTQEAIGDLLGALDDKIAVNDRIVSTSQELMVSHYKRGVARGARRVPLGEAASFSNSQRIPLSSREREARPGPYPYYGAAGVVGYVHDFIFSGPRLLVGEDGSVITPEGRPVTQYVWGEFWVNNHAHVLTGTAISTELLSIAMHFTNVAALVTGAVQPKLSMSNLRRLEVPIPEPEEVTQLEAVCGAIYELVRSRTGESRHLNELRDTLLPELMSGRLRVKDAEKVVEKAV
ncbi:restriction endonuclease subunit S [Micromonospora tulbaghiae]|uniref:restriction endonuclease subunit S n=1 Tax=Micromonospora tulbaghiae TaxID=479978 RepID=UPI0029C28839|nr:restriction endonuclease subunit S [Micromonospora tulbaghiae]MDX5459136.1 restriction endonuclease subunit S [Micromonospora tulbaghiae]